MRTKQFTVATLATLLIASSVVAQENQPPRTQNLQSRTTPAQSTGDSQTKDQTLAHCLAIANHEQVLISRFAKDKATHEDVKAFAAKLEKDHQTTLDQLKEFSPHAATIAAAGDRANRADANRTDANRADANRADANRAEANRADANRDDAAKLAETSLRTVEGQSSKVDFLQLHQEISTQCLKDSKEMLSSKDGIEFDQCFVGMQVAKHASAHSTLTVLERHASGKFQEFVKSQLETNAKHMEAAVSLMEKLADSDSSRSIR
jgi:predicted outer membrane protein